MLHKILIPMLFAPAVFATDITCYGGSAFTSCSNGASIYKYGAMTEITTPRQPDITVYRFGNLTNISSPNTATINPIIPSTSTNTGLGSFVLEPIH